MGKIRRLNFFDKKALCEIAKNMDNTSDFRYPFIKTPMSVLQSVLPLKMRRLPEAFVYIGNSRLQGMISLSTTRGNFEVLNITHLLFGHEDYLTGKKLVKFAIKHLGEVGAKTFKVVIDNNCKDLENLFINGCGFRCGSYENLWNITHEIAFFNNYEKYDFKALDDGHAQSVSELYNSEIIPYYRPALEHLAEEFKDSVLKFNDNTRENHYILFENRKRKKVIAYLTIQTMDNQNFIITPIKISGYELDYNSIIAFATQTIKRYRNSDFHAYVKQNKSLKFAQEFEDYLHERKYECVQTQHILIKDFYQQIKQPFQGFVFGENKLYSN